MLSCTAAEDILAKSTCHAKISDAFFRAFFYNNFFLSSELEKANRARTEMDQPIRNRKWLLIPTAKRWPTWRRNEQMEEEMNHEVIFFSFRRQR
jgi:hypothetical protein